MRLLIAFAALLAFALGGCGGSQAPIAGTIEFGTSQSNHIIHHPRTAFGPDDTFAYVAHVAPRTAIPPHTRLTESFFTVAANGKRHEVMSDSFRLKVPVTKFVVLNSIPVSDLYVVGFLAPGTYHVRLTHGHEKLAEGIFTLK